ncbi:hypothetical protein [Streptomyces sp. NPDC057682]|uniref:hypothetical protein n=1 Tax=Streptomyces sp. NPDC057682 TaxID=3346210 RepID=UPI00368B60AA
MTQIKVLNNSGRKLNGFAKNIELLADQIAPLVEDISRLKLPDTVVIRLMTPQAWRRARSRHDMRRMMAEASKLKPSTDSMRTATLTAKAARIDRRKTWAAVGGEFVDFTNGAEIVILPAALQEMGLLGSNESHSMVLAHELAHGAQHHVDAGMTWAQMKTHFPRERGTCDRSYGFLLEGHAHWVAHAITARLHGQSTTVKPGEGATSRHQSIHDSAEQQGYRRFHDRALQCVSKVIEDNGVEQFNRVWNAPELVPLVSESSNTEDWPQRLADELAK